VVAAAVIWPSDNYNLEINDSKTLTPAHRERLFLIVTQTALAVGVGVASVAEVDEMGVGQATYLAMQRAVDNLTPAPEFVLVDGYKVGFAGVESEGVIGGDGIYLPIAAASIVAKVTRDRMMVELGQKYPGFGFEIHKGYGTALHQKGLADCGVSDVHRKSFAPIRQQLERTMTKAG
jgi:ribonuclease HII